MKEEKEKTTKKTATKKTGAKTGNIAKNKTTTAKTKSAATKKANSTSTTKKTTSKKATTPATKKTTTPKKVETKKTTEKKVAKTPKEVKKIEPTPKKELEEIKNEKFIITEEVLDEVDLSFVELEKEENPKENEIVPEIIKENPKKEIPKTNYIVVAIIIIWVIIISFMGYNLYGKHQKQLYEEGYFNRGTIDIQKTTLKELRDKINEESLANIFILFNYHGSEEQYKLEKDMADLIKEYRLQKNFYYVDLNNEKPEENCDAVCMINKELGTNLVTNATSVVYVRNKKVLDVAQREDKKLLEAADFAKILDIYEFEK